MADPQLDGTQYESEAVIITGMIMLSAIIAFSMVIAVVVFLRLYWYHNSNDEDHHHRSVIATNHRCGGLDPLIIQSLPIVVFSPDEFKDGLECSVCLCEVTEGEKARILPKCNHAFHSDCIDAWLESHSTCPLCRNSILSELSSKHDGSSIFEIQIRAPAANQENGYRSEPRNLPTNMLFWGTQNGIRTFRSRRVEAVASSSASSSSKSEENRMLVIEIPLPLNRFPDEGSKSPLITGLRSLQRLLSRGKRAEVSSSNSGDIEQGESTKMPGAL